MRKKKCNSISNRPKNDTLTSKNFFIFAPFVGIIEIWKLWKIQLLTPSGSWDITAWKLGQNTLSGRKSAIYEVWKSHLEYTKTNQCSVISHFKFFLCLTGSGVGKVCGTTIIQKKIFSSETKDINLTFCQNWG